MSLSIYVLQLINKQKRDIKHQSIRLWQRLPSVTTCVLMASAGRERENMDRYKWCKSEHPHRQRCLPYAHIRLKNMSTQMQPIFPSFFSSLTQRDSCGLVVSVTLILLCCSSPDHISINLEQTQGSMRPELYWNQARGQLPYLLPCQMSNPAHYITRLQLTDWMAALIWRPPSAIHTLNLANTPSLHSVL